MSDLEIKYDYNFVRDTADMDITHRTKEIMILDLNMNSSIYYSEGYIKRRDILEDIISTARNSNVTPEIKIADLPKYKIGYSVYKNGSQIYVTSNLYRDFYTFESGFLKWNTAYNEEKSILGYKCHKATTVFNDKVYTAWYTKDIPISEGPYRFKGLPGLILELSDEKNYHSFVALGIQKKQVEIVPLQKGIPVTREQYIQKREEFRNDPYPGRVMDRDKKEHLKDIYRSNNNPLER